MESGNLYGFKRNTNSIDPILPDAVGIITEDHTTRNVVIGLILALLVGLVFMFTNNCQWKYLINKGDMLACYDENFNKTVEKVSVDQNPKICKNIFQKNRINECYAKVALYLKDDTLCENIKVDDGVNKDLCFRNTAESFGDKKYCASIVEPKKDNECLYNVAIKTTDQKICTEIVYPAYADSCFSDMAKITDKVSFCEKIKDDETKKQCIYWWVVKNRDYTPCSLFASLELQNQCKTISRIDDSNITLDFDESSLQIKANKISSITGLLKNDQLSPQDLYLEVNFYSSPSGLSVVNEKTVQMPLSFGALETYKGVLFSIRTTQYVSPGVYSGEVSVLSRNTKQLIKKVPIVVTVIK